MLIKQGSEPFIEHVLGCLFLLPLAQVFKLVIVNLDLFLCHAARLLFRQRTDRLRLYVDIELVLRHNLESLDVVLSHLLVYAWVRGQVQAN